MLLLAEELREVNRLLTDFVDSQSRANSYLGMASLLTIISPAVWAFLWWLESTSLEDFAMLALILAAGLFCLGLWWRSHATKSFVQFRSRGLTLERSGIPLRTKRNGILGPVMVLAPIGQSTEQEPEDINFEQLTTKELRRHLIALD
ncbi:MAG: hypothetical protein WBK51_03515 [Polaromonas sp.]